MACLDDIENVAVCFEYKTLKNKQFIILNPTFRGEDEYIALMTVIKVLS